MRILVALLVISSLTLAGCSGWRDSRVNPGNWFGNSSSKRVARTAPAEAEVNPLIPEQRPSIFRLKSDEETYEGTPVQSITSLSVERSSGGAIIRVTGLPLRQGAFDVRLNPLNGQEDEAVNGVLAYRLEALQPTNTPQGPQQTRRVNAARYVSDQVLRDVTQIQVRGVGNVLTSRR